MVSAEESESAGGGADRDDQVLGVDYGTVRIGLALGCPRTGLVLPLPVMSHPGSEEEVATRLCEVARGHGVGRVVIGDPVHMSGAKSPMSHTVANLRRTLEDLLGLPVVLQDERLTSAEAEAKLRAAGLRWWQVDKGQVDALSAMGIVRDLLHQENPALGLTDPETEAPPPPPDDPVDPDRRARRKRLRRRRD